MSKEKTSQREKEHWASGLDSPNVSGYVFVGPFLIGFLAFMMVPMLLSFCIFIYKIQYFTVPDIHWGGENYITMFTDDPKFWKVFGVTMYYVVFSVPLRLIMALIVAMLLVKSTKLSGFLQSSVLPSFHYRFQCGSSNFVEKNVRQ